MVDDDLDQTLARVPKCLGFLGSFYSDQLLLSFEWIQRYKKVNKLKGS